jgi:hypothetical protein
LVLYKNDYYEPGGIAAILQPLRRTLVHLAQHSPLCSIFLVPSFTYSCGVFWQMLLSKIKNGQQLTDSSL